MKILALAGVPALSSLPAASYAQTTAPTNTSHMTPASPVNSASQSINGMKMATSATMAVRFVTVKPADIMSSKLTGIDIYNNQNEKLGEIDDLVIEDGKTLTGLVVGVGGFLGMGESYVVIDPSNVVLNQKDGEWRAFIDTNKENLKNAPKFQYFKKKRG